MPPTSPFCLNVALIGNPNTGKSTVFGALVGGHQRVGNYPGVTVEKKTGRLELGGKTCEVVDLPGVYSLAPRSRDEMVTVDLLLGRRGDERPVDLVLCVVDASNLARNLYLVTQVLELGLPTVVALNMLDLAEDRGLKVDLDLLRRRLPVPIVPIQANRRKGSDELRQAIHTAAAAPPGESTSTATSAPAPASAPAPIREAIFPKAFCDEVLALAPRVRDHCALNTGRGQRGGHRWGHGEGRGRHGGSHAECECGRPCDCGAGQGLGMGRRRFSARWLAERLLLDVDGYLENLLAPDGSGELREALAAARCRLEAAGCAVPGVETESRHAWIRKTLDGVLAISLNRRRDPTDRIDRLLTHRVWGTLVFLVVMAAMFQAVFTWAAPATDAIAGLFDRLGDALRDRLVGTALSGGALESLTAVGILGGVGAVLSFLPQILVLFFFIALLEDCGYMARAAFLMDRLMSRVGLSGRSFIPLLSSHACAIPGIMATRVISDERDRLTTILVAPLMTCSARLPVYTLLIPAFVPSIALAGGWVSVQGLTLLGLYLLGIVTAVVAALVFRRTILRGPSPAFLLELPSYQWPPARVVFLRVVERGWVFVRTAGTMILGVSMVVWAALYFPHDASVVEGPFAAEKAALEKRLADVAALGEGLSKADDRAECEAALARLDAKINAAYQRQSYLARAGRAIEPAVKPLGWDWRIGCAVLAAFPAREAVVATLGVIFAHGELDVEEADDENLLRAHLRAATWEGTDRPLFTLPVALSILVFFALCAQCAATLAVIRRETNSWRWPIFVFVYMTVLAYVAALATYQAGVWLT